MNAWRKYRNYRTAVETLPDGDAFPGHIASMEATWDAMPMWLRTGLCLRCHWVDAVYEVNPRAGEWLVARRDRRQPPGGGLMTRTTTTPSTPQPPPQPCPCDTNWCASGKPARGTKDRPAKR